jgi:hypothetical protein
MAEDTTPEEEGSSRRSFLRRMAVTGLVGAPVVASFGLFGGCDFFPPGGGGNSY